MQKQHQEGNNATRYGDLWQWNGSMWDRLSDTGPEARISSKMVFLPYSQSSFLFGGETKEQVMGDSWIWNGEQWQKLDIKGPSRSQHALAYDEKRERVVLFGGTFNGEYQTGVWEWDRSEWRIAKN